MKKVIVLLLTVVLSVLCLCACTQEKKPCAHEWEKGICKICQETCSHSRYDKGFCKRCGQFHEEHSWWTESVVNGPMNDVCEVCGYKCLHTQLDENHVCSVCGKTIKHRYSDATHTCVAPGCDAESQYFYEGLPEGYSLACDQPGTMVEVTYTTPMYVAAHADSEYEGKTIEKKLYVYLPYNYDADKPYSILYLIHGSNGESATWLVHGEQTKNVVDNMIRNGDCEPCIIVTPSYYYGDKQLDNEIHDLFPLYFYEELREVIIPLVESKYLTYAGRDVTDESLTASRDYRAMAGFSRGSRTTLDSGMLNCLDWISYFGCFSGAAVDGSDVDKVLTSEAFAPFDIKFMYNGVGRCDYTRSSHVESYYSIMENCDKLKEGVNAVLVDKYGFEHDADNRTLDLFNFMMFDLFKHTEGEQ